MNTKSIYTVGKCLLLLLLIFTGYACEDNDEGKENTSAPVLISCNINGTEVDLANIDSETENNLTAGTDGYVEFVFSKTMRQTPPTKDEETGEVLTTGIYFNDKVASNQIVINYEKVRYPYSVSEGSECSLFIEAGTLTDMQHRPYSKDITLKFTATSGISGGDSETVFDAVVDANGRGDYTTVQAAINAAPANLTSPYLIFIAAGTYNECVYIPKTKPFIHLIGENPDRVKIQFALNRVEEQTNSDTWPYSIHNPNSPARLAGYTTDQNCVVLIKATDVYLENISIINLYGALKSRYDGGLGKGGQAEALCSHYDRLAMNNCKLVSFQDTWWTRFQKVNGTYGICRAYVQNSWIEGSTDYIWGSGDVLIENSTFYNTGNGSFITASRSNETDAYGYVMKDCTIDGEAGITAFSFGRQQSTSAKAVFINTALKMDIIDGHWTAGSAAPALFGEYNTVDKNNQVISTGDMTVGSGSSQFTAKVLSADEAAGYTYENIIAREGWNPKQYMQIPGTTMATLDGTTLSWNALDGAAGYLIFVNGVYLAQTTETSVSVTTAADGVYTVRGVGHYGSISAE